VQCTSLIPCPSSCLSFLQIDRRVDRLFYLDDIIGFFLPLFMYVVGNVAGTATLTEVFIAWNVIFCAASVTFSVIGLNAGHHGTEIAHEGDEFRSLDFGIYQMAATIDRYEANSNLFMILTHYGEHIMHHMLPTLDHSILFHFREILEETCVEFKEDLKLISIATATIEQFKQLKRTEVKALKEAKVE
jgi:fatty acid desaturase